MPYKDQTLCYRTFQGIKWINFCDVTEDYHNERVVEKKLKGARIKLIKHPDGYRQAFIHPEDFDL
jgi:hypothetical protein